MVVFAVLHGKRVNGKKSEWFRLNGEGQAPSPSEITGCSSGRPNHTDCGKGWHYEWLKTALDRLLDDAFIFMLRAE